MNGVHVIGGCYRETVDDPTRSAVCGSGLRAAAVMAGLGDTVVVITQVDDESAGEAGAVASAFGVELRVTPRPYPIEFVYRTPLARPSQTFPPVGLPAIDDAFEHCVAFGMTEGPWRLRSGQAVVDLQHATIETSGLTRSQIDRLALIVNAREARSLTGIDDLLLAAEALVQTTSAEVVVIKNGIRGAIVAATGEITKVGFHPAPSLFPIGSGDAFTAGFAHRWFRGFSGLEAAEFGSHVAATYCASGDPVVRATEVDESIPLIFGDECRVYLAGPFFNVAERGLVNHVREALLSLGADVFSPLHDVGLGGDEVAEQDLDGLHSCHSVLALLDHADPGTLFEVGWARKMNLPVVGFSSDPLSAEWTMLRGSHCELTSNLSAAVYLAGSKALRT